MPLQSGDNECLRRMKRTYTIEKYKSIIDGVREKIPNVAVTTDMIVGFCGETEEEFQSTLQAFRDIEFDQAYMFAYSPRHSTESWEWEDDVPHLSKQRRLRELIDLQNIISRDKKSPSRGRALSTCWSKGVSDRDPGRLIGRTRTNKLVIFPGGIERFPAGSYVEVETNEAFLWGFVGEATQPLDVAVRPRTLMELSVL
jgi:tRNA-2-methylthio-N6-dimethylallyladenosine synthase